MATTKLMDLVVTIGEYQNRNGETKKRYENVGSLMRNDNGQFLMLKRTFNPAGVPGDRDNILISMFEPKARDDNRQSGGVAQVHDGYGDGGSHPGSSAGDDLDHIPF